MSTITIKLLKPVILIYMLTGIVATGFGQTDVMVRRRDFKIGGEGFKEAWKQVRKGNQYMADGPGTFYIAREHYLKAYQYNSNNAELNYRIGLCYLYTDNKFQAIDYFRKAFETNPDVSEDIHFMIARALHLLHDFENAIEEYKAFKNSLSPKAAARVTPEITRLIKECQNGMEQATAPKRVIITPLPSEINSPFDDYNPVFNNDSLLYFTSRRGDDENYKRSKVDNKFFEDIYSVYSFNGKWQPAYSLTKPVNDKKNNLNNAIVEISNDGLSLYAYQGKIKAGNIAVHYNKNGKWKKATNPGGKINSKFRETSVNLSPDEKTIYFVSDRPKGAKGGTDIWMAKKDIKGRWGKPINLGSEINSIYNEESPFYDADSGYLYFSSTGHNTIGGYDVFRSKLNENGRWSAPENLGMPVNSADDDLFFKITGKGRNAYLTTIRDHGFGYKDIFYLTFLGQEKEMIPMTEDIPFAGLMMKPKSIFFHKPAFIQIDTTLTLFGKVFDEDDKKGIVAKLEIVDNDLNKVIATSISSETGEYKATLPSRKKYGVQIVAKDYMLFLGGIDLAGTLDSMQVTRDFGLTKVEVGAKLILKNIFFETGKATLMPESFQQLQSVKSLLENNPSLKIEISGHTDNIGSFKSNQKLSEERAKSVADYLIGQGVSNSRIEYKGYSFSQPIAPNSTADGRAQNRRVEFKILSK